MKKLIISFGILLILAAVLFFIGWVQYLVPAGSYGVLSSKTSGVDARLLESGEFRWAWERLIPRNARVEPFTLKNTETKASISGKLPSAELYAQLIDTAIDFTYKIEVTVLYTINSKALTRLVAEEGVTNQSSLDAWLDKKGDAIRGFMEGHLLTYALEGASPTSSLKLAELISKLESELAKEFPSLENISCTITNSHFPDISLYVEARQRYTDYLERRRNVIAATLAANAEASAKERLRFEELERYAELLEKHPVLIKYLAIEAISQQDNPGAAGSVASGMASLLNALGQ